jgi:glycosyltransferase involved in cell wall biosynthesis
VRILFLSHYFPPEVNAPASRTHEHCRQWAAAGHEVHVITCVPSHPAGSPFPGYRRGWYLREELDGVHVHRVWTHLAPNRGVVRRTLNYLSFVPPAIFRSWRLGRFDVIVATSPQFFCAVAGRGAAALHGTPWVFELRDLWPESIQAVGAVRRSPLLQLLERLELRLYAHARAVVCVTQGFVTNLDSRGVDARKLKYVPNGIAPEFWASGSRAAGRARLGLTPVQIAVTYTGTIGMAHGLGTMLHAARLLEASLPQVRIFVVGDGAELDALKARAADWRLTNVEFTGLLPRADIADVLAASDIALVTLKRADTFKSVLPSKMFEAMAAGRPIVLGVEGEALRVLNRATAGIGVPPGDHVALARAVARLARRPWMREQLGRAGRDFVSREFNRSAWAERYLEILADASHTCTGSPAFTASAPLGNAPQRPL